MAHRCKASCRARSLRRAPTATTMMSAMNPDPPTPTPPPMVTAPTSMVRRYPPLSTVHDYAAVVPLTSRAATRDDVPVLLELIEAAIVELQRGFLDAAQIASSRSIMGLDTQL